MIRDEVLKLLRCVETKQPLQNVDDRMLQQLNEAISERRLSNRMDQPIDQPLTGALINQDRTVIYPIFDGIPVLIYEEAIRLTDFPEFCADQSDPHP